MCTANGCNFPGKDKYFFQIDPSNPSSGCRPYNPVVCSRTPTGSSRTPHHSFLELEQVSYLSYMWENAFIVELVKGDYYRNLFSTNCSCKEAFIGYDVKSISTHGYCYLKSSVFPLQKNNKTSGFYYNSIVYIKVQSRPKPPNYSVIIITVSVAGAAATLFLLLWAWIYKLANGRAEEQKDGDLDFPTGSPVRYSFEDLQKATNDFNMRLGSGGFSSVYEGVLLDNTKIVVKQLDRIFPNESHQHVLDWKVRSKVILHIERGLSYLHEECRERIIHFDIKRQNILLDENFNAKVSDFGLAKLINREQSEVITMLRGTPGYMAPELLDMKFTEKADIYSFGVMVVETVSGRRSREHTSPGSGLFPVL
ncbi:G-type lectin S-receptor-like serine/threonine-protein kinase SD2-5 [Cryptomeria japonica]|uniref:G-type lectin S-receptor-like serine/threonine-protein kinase SD2-5 n=1 Tax=Cryptomeria japonica TaxID=3369 RepID=UPI0027DA8243|nr:G-type lectin S-receptor-like serine/threonine-protein kinase SD2-5 [Cryptomeria japonica]